MLVYSVSGIKTCVSGSTTDEIVKKKKWSETLSRKQIKYEHYFELVIQMINLDSVMVVFRYSGKETVDLNMEPYFTWAYTIDPKIRNVSKIKKNLLDREGFDFVRDG